MSKQFGYYVGLSSVQLSDASSSWIHALPVGEYQHPVYGLMRFTADRIKRFADNVKNRVRGIDPNIDYDHAANRGTEAAGWVKDARVQLSGGEGDGLWLNVSWTNEAAQKIKDNVYRYFSSDFIDEWEDPQGRKFQDVILGGGLTNRPYLKNLLPVNLSELTFSEPTKERKPMDPKRIRELLNLPEDASDEQVEATLVNYKQANPQPPADPNNPPNPTHFGGVPEGGKDPEGNPFRDDKKLAEQIAALTKQLGENAPAVAMLKLMQETQAAQAQAFQDQQKQLAELQAAKTLAEVTNTLNEVQAVATGKNIAIAPTVLDEAKALMLKAPGVREEIKSLLGKIADGNGVQKLGETPGARQGGGANREPSSMVDAMDSGIKKLMEGDNKLTYADAMENWIREHPAEYAQYRQDTYLTH